VEWCLLGPETTARAVEANAWLTGRGAMPLRRIAAKPIDFFPAGAYRRMVSLLGSVGRVVASPRPRSPHGAPSAAFASATNTERSPLAAWGFYRVGEDGRLYLTTKSEHYHTPLGHGFAGYRLLAHARALGIPNATHNNTRGAITRSAEAQLVRSANGLAPDDRSGLQALIDGDDPRALRRVINLETGSLAVAAALKMMLARFYRPQEDSPAPPYAGRIPVFLVVGNDAGELQANYHGTTLIEQVLRGMWGDLRDKFEQADLLRVRCVRPNRLEDIETAFGVWDRPPFKIAGFLHELILMNYCARRLDEAFVRRAYELADAHDVPTLVDEIQSCLWSPRLYHFREYAIRPDFVAIGKGFPGGEYAASKILFSARMDTLPQFGALVTNGQEELASLAYLVTMRWAEENADVTQAIGEHYEARLRETAARYPALIAAVEGQRHMIGLTFHDLDNARRFASHLNEHGIDISVQTYKTSIPPTALTKLPLIAGTEVVDWFVDLIDEALAAADSVPRR